MELITEDFEKMFALSILNEEEADRYFKYIVKKALSQKYFTDDEIKNINIERFNDELKRDIDVKDDYFEGETFKTFRVDFMKYLRALQAGVSSNGRRLTGSEAELIKEFLTQLKKQLPNWRDKGYVSYQD